MNKNERKLNEALSHIDPELIEEAALSVGNADSEALTGGRLGRLLRVCIPAAIYTALLIAVTVGALHFATPVDPPSTQPEDNTPQTNPIINNLYDIFSEIVWADGLPDSSISSIITDILERDPVGMQPPAEGEGKKPETSLPSSGAPDAPQTESADTEIPSDSVIPSVPTVPPTTYRDWNGLNVSNLLAEQLESGTEKPMAVQVSQNSMPDLSDYTYQGKTLEEWAEEIRNNEQILDQLSKLAEMANNPELDITPDLEALEQYGKELLEQFIQSGKLNPDTVYNAATAVKEKLSELAYGLERLYDSYYEKYGDQLKNMLEELGTHVYASVTNGDSLVFAAPSELAKLAHVMKEAGLDLEDFRFDLASRSILDQINGMQTDPSYNIPIGEKVPSYVDELPIPETTDITCGLEPVETTVSNPYPEPETEIMTDTIGPAVEPIPEDTEVPNIGVPDSLGYTSLWGGMFFDRELMNYIMAAQDPSDLNILVTPKVGVLTAAYEEALRTEYETQYEVLEKEVEDTLAAYKAGEATAEEYGAVKNRLWELDESYQNRLNHYEERTHLGDLLNQAGYYLIEKHDQGIVIGKMSMTDLENLPKALSLAGVDPEDFLLTVVD